MIEESVRDYSLHMNNNQIDEKMADLSGCSDSGGSGSDFDNLIELIRASSHHLPNRPPSNHLDCLSFRQISHKLFTWDHIHSYRTGEEYLFQNYYCESIVGPELFWAIYPRYIDPVEAAKLIEDLDSSTTPKVEKYQPKGCCTKNVDGINEEEKISCQGPTMKTNSLQLSLMGSEAGQPPTKREEGLTLGPQIHRSSSSSLSSSISSSTLTTSTNESFQFISSKDLITPSNVQPMFSFNDSTEKSLRYDEDDLSNRKASSEDGYYYHQAQIDSRRRKRRDEIYCDDEGTDQNQAFKVFEVGHSINNGIELFREKRTRII